MPQQMMFLNSMKWEGKWVWWRVGFTLASNGPGHFTFAVSALKFARANIFKYYFDTETHISSRRYNTCKFQDFKIKQSEWLSSAR